METMAVAEASSSAAPAFHPQADSEHRKVSGGDVAARLRSWSEILATTHLPFDVRPTDRTPSGFHGAVTRRAIGDLALIDYTASPFHGYRGHEVMASRSTAPPTRTCSASS